MQNYIKSQTRLAFVQYIFQNEFLNTDSSEGINDFQKHFYDTNIAIIDEGSIVENTSMKELLSRLSIQSFVLDLEDEIQELPNLSIFDLKSEDSKTLIATLTKDDDLNTLFHKLSEHGIKVKSMRNEQNRLEELFIKLVKEKDGN